MRVATRENRALPLGRTILARMACMAMGWVLVGAPAGAQDAHTGVSMPSSTGIAVEPGDTVSPLATSPSKPSAGVAAAKNGSTVAYGPYVPYGGTDAAGKNASAPNDSLANPDANIVTEATAGQADRRVLSGDARANADAGIVTYVPSEPGEVPDGTLMKVKLREDLSTLTTRPGTRFTAEVAEAMTRDGRVIVPAGAVVEGRVTWVRGGRRIGGQAAIHLEPESVTLPDGSQYVVQARAIDTDAWQNTRVDSEGTILRRDHAKATLSAMGLATGGAMAAGAVMGGVPGALIGAGVGAGASTVVWLKQDRQAELPKDLGVVFSLTSPMRVTPATADMAPLKMGGTGGK